MKDEGCHCEDCRDSGEPCHFDCDYDEMCIGCQQAAEIEADEENLEPSWRDLLR